MVQQPPGFRLSFSLSHVAHVTHDSRLTRRESVSVSVAPFACFVFSFDFEFDLV